MDSKNIPRTKTRAYRCWQDLKQRCLNPNSQAYKDYGGRGITVCQRWIDSFDNFLSDMGQPPDGMSLDRINNDGGYSPDNCRWATHKTQCSNTRASVKLTCFGKTQTLTEWAEELGIDHRTVNARYRRRFSPEMILSKSKFAHNKPTVRNKSGLLGASPFRDKWKSQIYIRGKVVYLGLFDTPQEASAAYFKARATLKHSQNAALKAKNTGEQA